MNSDKQVRQLFIKDNLFKGIKLPKKSKQYEFSQDFLPHLRRFSRSLGVNPERVIAEKNFRLNILLKVNYLLDKNYFKYLF